MTIYDMIKKDVSGVTGDILSSIEQSRLLTGVTDGPLQEWEQIVRSLSEQLDGQLLRVAVVGAIKSGKSTFINSLIGKDYLKRGAGVMTSIITRVRKSPRLEAELDMKTWDEVNEEINKALILFPSPNESSRKTSFDIRNDSERNELEQSLALLDREHVLGKEALDSKIALLRAYLKGYDRVRHILASGTPVQKFQGEAQFARHRDFAGEDSLAVYLKDLLLRVPAEGFFDDSTEIGDCQGVDSINPRHLAMIQEYLLRTNLIIYVISSRTGLRRADVGFLSLIQQMGFSDTVLFVLNADFHEHTDLRDLENNARRVREELSIVMGDSKIFVFSALYSLFSLLGPDLPEREAVRLEQWRKEKEMASFSDEERERFISILEGRLRRDRSNYLLKNHLERLSTAAANLREWAAFNGRILSGNLDEVRQATESVREARQKLEEQKTAIKDSLDGRAVKIKREIGNDIDRFLDGRFGELSLDIKGFVESYSIDLRARVRSMPDEGFSAQLYALFQEFRESFERFIVEKINPRLVTFIREEEKKVEEMFVSVAGLHEALARDAFLHHESILGRMGITQTNEERRPVSISIESLKKKAHPSMPSFLSTLQFGLDIRAGATVKLGIYRGMSIIRKIFKRPGKEMDHEVLSALGDALRRIKRETEASLNFTINDYKERLKFQHLYRFTDNMARDLHDLIVDRFRLFSVDMSELAVLVEKNQEEKGKAIQMASTLEVRSEEAMDKIRMIEQKLTAS
ncbi:MAG: dynamin family protein [Syntrophales bacterium]|nr:dynamin family protein [Syntrophales bacterium]